MKYRWSIASWNAALTGALAKQGGISELLAQCLINRGLEETESIESFLDPRLKRLSDPFLVPDLQSAVERLWKARELREPVVVLGDYDVDGITSTAILAELLGTLGWAVRTYLPHRMDEGYGLSEAAVANCLKRLPCRVLIAVDCGSTASITIEALQTKGVDVIVLDHHQVSVPPPRPWALVNPQNRSGPGDDLKELCSAGLAFKLAHGLVKKGRDMGMPEAREFDVRRFLDLVALGTIADLVPLTGENRILAHKGLGYLNASERPGLTALKEVSRSGERVGVYEVGFQLAPRLNAAGRLEEALNALRLLQATEMEEAQSLARALDRQNRERQRIEQSITEEVSRMVRAKFRAESDFVIVEGDVHWHVGVVGIVASRVVREFYRPTIIVGGDGVQCSHGSGRSIDGFDLAEALRDCDDLLLNHGGHAMAAGITIEPDSLEAFRDRLNALARKRLSPKQFYPELAIDATVGLSELTLARVEELGRLEPSGQGNPRVRLKANGLAHAKPPKVIGRDQKHVKCWVTDGSATREVIWWGGGSETWPEGRFDLAFEPQINEFNGERSVQLKLLDWKQAG